MFNEAGVSVLVGSRGEQYDAGVELAVALGNATGTVGSVIGYVGTSATSIVAVRGTTYTEQGAAAAREVVSSSAADASAGTGARTIRITYYDNSMAGPKTTDVTMNGTTAVATSASDIRFVEKMEVLTAGSGASNAGTITLRLTGAGATIGTIAVSDNQTFWAHHYVAAGKTCFVQRVICGTNGVSGSMFLRKFLPLTANAVEIQITPSLRAITAQPSFDYDMETGLYVTGPARIVLYTKPDILTGSTTHGGFNFFDF